MKSKQVMMSILALLPCTLSGCSELNTRIGWPWTYCAQGFWPVVGFLAVGFLIFVGIGGVIASFDASEGDRGMVILAAFFLILAGFLLQTLPHTATGIQFVPLSPWNYDGWIARSISSICWLALVLGCLTAFSRSKADWKGSAIAIFVALGLNTILSFAGSADATASTVTGGQSPAITSCNEKIAYWETLRKERSDTLEKLSSDKEMLVARIRSFGCRTKQELMAHSVGCTLAHELEQLSRQIAQLQTETSTIEATVERAQSALRCVEREAMLKEHGMLSDEEFARVSKIDHELQEELRKMAGEPTPGSEVRMDKLLDEALAQPESANR
jgi:hypothetical protein